MATWKISSFSSDTNRFISTENKALYVLCIETTTNNFEKSIMQQIFSKEFIQILQKLLHKSLFKQKYWIWTQSTSTSNVKLREFWKLIGYWYTNERLFTLTACIVVSRANGKFHSLSSTEFRSQLACFKLLLS